MINDIVLEPLVRQALLEDLGRAGDITSQALIPENKTWKAHLVAREEGVLAGVDLARLAFTLVDPQTSFVGMLRDGASLSKGSVIATVSGPARSLLASERVALNFLSHLSGVATLTRRFVEAVRPHKARICCTRKTTPLLRAVEKAAVLAGGGSNHRFGLDDAVLIKDNHIAVVGSIRDAVIKAKQSVGHMVKIEVEVDGLNQLREILDAPADVVMLDNFSLDDMKAAVDMVSGRFVIEASGGVRLDTVAAIAATGIDYISVGALTHSAPALDISLDSAD